MTIDGIIEQKAIQLNTVAYTLFFSDYCRLQYSLLNWTCADVVLSDSAAHMIFTPYLHAVVVHLSIVVTFYVHHFICSTIKMF